MQKREQDTKRILQVVETLNDEGRQKVREYIADLQSLQKYKRGVQSKSRPQFEVIEGGRSGTGAEMPQDGKKSAKHRNPYRKK